MKLLLKKALLLVITVLMVNTILVEIMNIDQTLLREIGKVLFISLCIQPWVMFQFTH